MKMYSNISMTASLIGHPARLAILMALSDGKSLPAGDLAAMAGVSPQTASAHLAKLEEGALITVEKWGRHRYYKLSGPEVAEAIEAIAVIAPTVQVQSLRESNHKQALYFGRTCYGHLAGKIGVQLTESLLKLDYLQDSGHAYRLTDKGWNWLLTFMTSPFSKGKDADIPYHIDWTERKRHIAGPLALDVTQRLFDLGWIRKGAVPRSVQITDQGRIGILDTFGFDPS